LNATKSPRRWLPWTIAGVWIGTALAGVIATRVHPPTVIAASLNVRRLSFRTNADRILGPGNEEQLLVSGVRLLQIHMNKSQSVDIGGSKQQASELQIVGEPFASCSFYQVRSDGFDLNGDSVLTMGWDQAAGERPANASSFSFNVHGSLKGSLTSQAAAGALVPGFTCTRVRVNGGLPGEVESKLSPQGGDSISLTTFTDSRLDFDLAPQTDIGDTQIPILGEIRFWQVEPGTEDTKTVLLAGENKVAFENVHESFTLDEADLLLIVPKSDFYLRRFVVKDGIHLSLHGVVKEVRAGPGAGALETHMPSLFDHVDNTKRFWAVILVVVSTVIGFLDRVRWLANK
jgi:hypothetical protein